MTLDVVPESMVTAFQEWVRHTPEAPAVGEVSYAELDHRARGVAGYLAGQGVTRGGVVALAIEDPVELVTGMLGVLMAGGAYLAIDPSLPPDRIDVLRSEAEPQAVLTDLAPHPGSEPPELSADDLACVFFTSGTTGRPKAVPLPHRGILRLFRGDPPMDLRPGARMALAAYPMFDAHTLEVWGPLLQGGTCVPLPRQALLNSAGLRNALRQRQIDTLFVTTALFREIAVHAPDAFADLDTVYVGGEALDAGPVRAVLAAGPPQRLRNLYGPTENTTLASWHEITLADAEAGGAIPIGRAVPGTELHIVDGELHVGGDGLGPGYLHRPGLTAIRYVPDPARPGARMYRTGDLVRDTASGIVFCGRSDRQIKFSGYRIELEEIESVLASCPGVTACAVEVTAAPQLAAYVGGSGVTEAEIRVFLARRLPAHMVPSLITVMDRLPVTEGGKLDRQLLNRPLPKEPDDGAVEGRVARVWAEVLGVSTVERDRNFFDAGGSSLLLMRLQAGLGAAIGRTPSIGELLAHTTVRAQSRLTDQPAPAPPTEPRISRLGRRRQILAHTEGEPDE